MTSVDSRSVQIQVTAIPTLTDKVLAALGSNGVVVTRDDLYIVYGRPVASFGVFLSGIRQYTTLKRCANGTYEPNPAG